MVVVAPLEAVALAVFPEGGRGAQARPCPQSCWTDEQMVVRWGWHVSWPFQISPGGTLAWPALSGQALVRSPGLPSQVTPSEGT